MDSRPGLEIFVVVRPASPERAKNLSGQLLLIATTTICFGSQHRAERVFGPHLRCLVDHQDVEAQRTAFMNFARDKGTS